MSYFEINYEFIDVVMQSFLFDLQFISYIFAAREYKGMYGRIEPDSL